jgi:crossover junction endodeoxyribonuclease RuvC
VGVGRAEKSQVSFMVGQLLGVKPDWAEDAGDALALAVCHLNHFRFMAAVNASNSGQSGATRL